MSDLYLSKSRYLSGLKCERQLWLDVHGRDRATAVGQGQQHIFDTGHEVGRAAHHLFPGGVLIDSSNSENRAERHNEAVAWTRALMADEEVPAIFEAAFEFESVRVRVDVLERSGQGCWGMREVKASTKVKRDAHLPDIAIQRWVLEGCGLEIDSVEILHVNSRYVRGEEEVEWAALFVREEMIEALLAFESDELSEQIAEMRTSIALPTAPHRQPGDFCKRPYRCRYWEDCTSLLPPAVETAVNKKKRPAKLRRPVDADPNVPWYSPQLAEVLSVIKAPVWALDFEAIGPAIPRYRETRPYQALAFQWSLHRLGEAGDVDHFEFLATGQADPRPDVARALVDRLGADSGSGSILSYSNYERNCIADMAGRCPDLAESLRAISARIVDLYPIVKKHVDHPEFGGSYSMKTVGPVLAGAVAYEELPGVADGMSAASAFADIVAGRLSPSEERRTRTDLLAYCALDTRALLGVYQALVREVNG